MATKPKVPAVRLCDVLEHVAVGTDYFKFAAPGSVLHAMHPFSRSGLPQYVSETHAGPCLAFQHIKLCIESDNPRVAGKIVSRLITHPEGTDSGCVARERNRTVLLPLITLLSDGLQPRPGPEAQLDELCSYAVRIAMGHIIEHGHTYNSQGALNALYQAAVLAPRLQLLERM